MLIDGVTLLVVAALAFLGWRSGLLRQVVHWVALAGAAALAAPLGRALVPALQPYLVRLPPWAVPTVALFVAGTLLFVVFDLGALILIRLLGSTKEDNALRLADRFLGAIFGGAKGLVLVLLIGTGLHLLRSPLATAFPRFEPVMAQSLTLGAIEAYNPLVGLIEEWRGEGPGNSPAPSPGSGSSPARGAAPSPGPAPTPQLPSASPAPPR